MLDVFALKVQLNPFQWVIIYFDGEQHAHSKTFNNSLWTLLRWSPHVDNILFRTPFPIFVILDFKQSFNTSLVQITTIFKKLFVDRIVLNLDTFKLQLTSPYIHTFTIPPLPNLCWCHLTLELLVQSVSSRVHLCTRSNMEIETQLIFHAPKLQHLSVKLNNTWAICLCTSEALSSISLDFTQIGCFHSQIRTTLHNVLYSRTPLLQNLPAMLQELTLLHLRIWSAWLENLGQLEMQYLWLSTSPQSGTICQLTHDSSSSFSLHILIQLVYT